MVTQRVKEAAERAGLGTPLRRLRHALEPAYVTRDRRDREQLRAILAAELRPDSNCIDVGAAEGGVLADIVRLAPRGRHIAYEPLPDHSGALRRRFPGVEVRGAALSDHEGEASFVHVVTRPGWSGFRERPYPARERVRRITVPVERLDGTLPGGYVPAFIKVDVEGAELEVLAGAIETIAAHRPLVAFEHGLGSADHYGTRPEQIHDLLCGRAGLRIFDLAGEGPYDRGQFVRSFHGQEQVNFIARP